MPISKDIDKDSDLSFGTTDGVDFFDVCSMARDGYYYPFVLEGSQQHVTSLRRLEFPNRPVVARKEVLQNTGFGLSVDLPFGSTKGSSPKQGSVQNFELPFGLTILTGQTSVGKSVFLKTLTEAMPSTRYMCVEPFDDHDDFASMMFYDTDSAIYHILTEIRHARASGHPPSLPLLDSLRAPAYEIQGSAGEKGMIMAFFTRLTRLSNTLAENGVTLVASLNPLQTDPAAYDAYINRLKSAVPCVIELKAQTRVGSSVEFTGDFTVRPKRSAQSFVWRHKGERATIASTFFEQEVNMHVDDDDRIEAMTPAARRIFSN